MKRTLLFLIPLVLLVTAALTLVATPLGLQIGYQLLRKELPGELHIESIAGSLLGTIELKTLRYQDNTLRVALESVELAWQWQALLDNRIHIGTTTARQLVVDYTPSSSADTQQTEVLLGPYLAENLIVDTLRLDEVHYRQGNTEVALTDSTLHIKQGSLDLTTGILYQADAHEDSFALQVSLQLQQLAQSWQIHHLDLTLPSDIRLAGNGSIHFDRRLALQLEWQQLQWPLTDTERTWPVTLGKGTAELSGTMDNLQFATQSAFSSNIVSGNLHSRGQVQHKRLELSQLAIDTPSGNLNGTASLQFADRLTWQTSVAFSALDTAVIDTRWPGKLAGNVTINGSYVEERLQQNIQLHSLSGSLRGYPVAANGTFRHSDQHLNIRQLAVQSGETKIALDGEVNQNWQTHWSVSSPDLAELWPDAQGALQASGSLSGSRNHPIIESTFSGQALQFEDYQIQSINGDLHIDTSANGQWSATAQAQQVRAGDQWLQQATLSLQGHVEQHRLQLEIQHQQVNLQLLAEGTFLDQQWQGTLTRADWQSPQLGLWQLQSPVAGIVVNPREVLLPITCWQQEPARLCSDFNYRQASGWAAAFEGQQLPLALGKPWLPAQFSLAGHASTTGTLQAGPDTALPERGQLKLNLGKGSVRYSEQEEAEIDFMGGELALWLSQQNLSATLALQFNEHAELNGDARIKQLYTEAPQLTGQLRGSLDELGVFEPFITQIDQLSGKLFANITLQGNLYQPRLQGKLAVTEGRFIVPQTAVAYQAIELSITSETTHRLKITGSAHSAEQGELRVSGKLLLPETRSWEMQLKLRGEEFLISDTLETQIRVNPELQLQIQPYLIRLNGNLEIPQARLKPEDYQGVVTPSRDTEFVGGETQTIQSRWQFYSRITISLGEDVYFHGFGLQGFINGQVTIQDEPGLLTRGTGELAIRDGLYRAYGQDLDIDIGRLLFNNSPLDSPAILIRAARTVGTITAGMQADGPIRSPDVSLYSEPAMSDSDTLSYLLFGRPLNQSSKSETATLAKAASAIGLSGGGLFAAQIGEQLGLDEVSVESGETLEETALLVGKYLSPSLYLGYSVGLFEPINTVLLRYRINENWMIETETGVESGGDILYTIER